MSKCKTREIQENSCFNCDFALLNIKNKDVNKDVKCDRELLTRDYIYTPDKPELRCACNSHINIEETRYGFPNVYQIYSDDTCDKCGRIVRDLDFAFVKFARVINGELKNITLQICKMCNDKHYGGKHK